MCIWIGLRKHLTRGLWLTVWVGFLGIFFNRINELIGLSPLFGHLSGLAIAYVGLVACITARQFVEQAKALAVIARNQGLGHRNEPIATQLAELIVSMKEKIQFYETQAEKHRLAKYDDVEKGPRPSDGGEAG